MEEVEKSAEHIASQLIAMAVELKDGIAKQSVRANILSELAARIGVCESAIADRLPAESGAIHEALADLAEMKARFSKWKQWMSSDEIQICGLKKQLQVIETETLGLLAAGIKNLESRRRSAQSRREASWHRAAACWQLADEIKRDDPRVTDRNLAELIVTRYPEAEPYDEYPPAFETVRGYLKNPRPTISI